MVRTSVQPPSWGAPVCDAPRGADACPATAFTHQCPLAAPPLRSLPSPSGKVILTVKSAHNMKDKAWLGKSDPYW